MKWPNQHTHTIHQHQQKGISLVELMVAMALGLVLTLGVTQVFLGSSKTYRTTEAVAYLQENLRYSLARISADVRMAGSTGCLVGEPTDHLRTGNGYQADLWDEGIGVVGWEAKGTGLEEKVEVDGFSVGAADDWSDDVPDDIVGNAISGTDIIVVTGAELTTITLSANPSGNANTIGTTGDTGINANSIMITVAEDCSAGDRFQKTNGQDAVDIGVERGGAFLPGNDDSATAIPLQTYTDKASVYRYRSMGYFIGLGVNGEPALFRIELTPPYLPSGSNNPVELVSGVENMQILYGLATNKKRADTYVDASDVTSWEDVVSVRIALLMRSADQILDEDNTQTFNLAGVEVDPGSDRRARLVATTTVGIRNRLE